MAYNREENCTKNLKNIQFNFPEKKKELKIAKVHEFLIRNGNYNRWIQKCQVLIQFSFAPRPSLSPSH